MKRIGYLLILFLASLSTGAWAITTTPGARVDQDDFGRIAREVTAYFVPEIQAQGNQLTLDLQWNDDTDLSYASFESAPAYLIHVSGGAARNVDQDGYAFVLCHELGHILGGTPKINPGFWASAEEQADYFATNVCLKKVFAADPNATLIRSLRIPATLSTACGAKYHSDSDIALCERVGMAGFSFAEDYRRFKGVAREIAFDTPDPLVVRQLNAFYPSPQCRLDTILAGDLSSARPRCWFHP